MGITRIAIVGVAVAGCSMAPVASTPYLSPPQSSDSATGFAGMTRALNELRKRHDEKRTSAPIALSTTDGNGLILRSIKSRAVIDGPLAVTELKLMFENPEQRIREGRFTIALPDGAAISRLAMVINSQWMEAEVVPRQRARQVYESHLRPVRDPALLERDAGNVFSARVFPIEAGAKKELVVTYAQEVSATRPYQLYLAGLPAVDELEITVDGGAAPVSVRDTDKAPEDVIVATTGVGALVAGDAVVMRFSPVLQTPAEPITELTILVDTSASRAGDLGAQADAVRALVLALQRRGLARVEVAAFDQAVVPIIAGRPEVVADHVVDGLIVRGALGASDLGAALAWAAPRGNRILVVGDGLATAGELDPAAIAAMAKGAPRVDVLALGGRADREALIAVVSAGERSGMIMTEADVESWAHRLVRGVLAEVPVSVSGAAWVWPDKLESIQPGDEVVVMARMITEADRREVIVGLGSQQTVTVPARKAHAALVDRAVVGADIARRRRALAGATAEVRGVVIEELTALAVKHRLLTDETGLLVLETEADYARWCLDRTALADILAIEHGAIRVVDRSGGKGATLHCKLDVSGNHGGQRSITGIVREQGNNEPLIGATVVATSKSMAGEQVAISDESGRYEIEGLPPGTYDLTFYYLDRTFVQKGVVVTGVAADGAVTAEGPFDASYTRNIPVPGRTFESALGAAAGSQGDSLGVSFSGSSSTENQYYVDGVNTSGLSFGTSADASMPISGRSFGEAISISDRAPSIDPTSTLQTRPYELGPQDGTDFRGPRLPTRRSYRDDDADDWKPKAPAGGKSAWSGRYAKVMKLIRSGDVDRAVGEAVAWQAATPGDLLAVVALGDALEARGKGALAARAYGSILDLFPRRAELARATGERLERVGATALAIEAYRRAIADRPDQATGHRLLAWALVRTGDLEGALAAIEAGRARTTWQTQHVLDQDFAMIAAAIVARDPARRAELAKRAGELSTEIASAPSVRFVLVWETDASDVDLHVIDRRNHRAWDEQPTLGNVTGMQTTVDAGWGPEMFAMSSSEATQGPYRLMAYLADAGPQGHTLGTLQVIEHDGKGGFLFDHRPFVITRNHTYADLGTWR
jgi:tetratricopeptide (TPR) repeat protein